MVSFTSQLADFFFISVLRLLTNSAFFTAFFADILGVDLVTVLKVDLLETGIF
jgi:hypothetical protein